MKLKEIEKLCSEEGSATLFQGADCQWLGCNEACYAVTGLPRLTKNIVCTLFDIPPEKRDWFIFNELPYPPTHLNFADIDETEVFLEPVGYRFTADKRELMPLKGSLGLITVETALLKPFSGTPESFSLFERIDSNGRPYIAVKGGLMLLGLIQPYKIITDEFLEQMKAMTYLSSMTLQNAIDEE